jgi:hypothetical protein
MLAKKTSKNQITLPREIIKTLPVTEYFDVSIKDSTIRLIPVKLTPAQSSLDSVRDKIKRLGLTEKEVGEAIQRARSRKR